MRGELGYAATSRGPGECGMRLLGWAPVDCMLRKRRLRPYSRPVAIARLQAELGRRRSRHGSTKRVNGRCFAVAHARRDRRTNKSKGNHI